MILRSYQQLASDSVMKNITAGVKKVGTILPVGSGKTIIFIDIAQRYINIYSKKVLVLSDSSILTQQNSDRFRSFLPEKKTGILQADRIPDGDCDVIIATVQSGKIEDKIMSWLGNHTDEIGLIIIDEMHCLQTKSYDTALGYFPNAVQYGTTATPYRDRQLMTNYFDSIAYTISMQELIANNYLVPIELQQILRKDDALAQCVEIYRRSELGCKAGIFLKTQKEAKLLRNLFEENDIRAEVILGDTSASNRKTIIEDFNNGDLDILCTCNVISKGFDSHKLEVVMMPYGTQSPTLFMQRVGRGTRPQDGNSVKPEHTKQSCRVYMFGSAPSIKHGYYKKLEQFVLKDGDSSNELDIHDDLEIMELLENDKSSQSYIWTKDLCDISLKLQELGKVELDQLIRQKKLPNRYLKNPKLLVKGLEGNFSDNMNSFISNIKKQIESNSDQDWIISDGLHVGKDVRKLHSFLLLKLVKSQKVSVRTRTLIKKWWHHKKLLKRSKV